MTRNKERLRQQSSAQALLEVQQETTMLQELLAAERRVNGYEKEIALKFNFGDAPPDNDEPSEPEPDVLELYVLIDALAQMF